MVGEMTSLHALHTQSLLNLDSPALTKLRQQREAKDCIYHYGTEPESKEIQ